MPLSAVLMVILPDRASEPLPLLVIFRVCTETDTPFAARSMLMPSTTAKLLKVRRPEQPHSVAATSKKQRSSLMVRLICTTRLSVPQ